MALEVDPKAYRLVITQALIGGVVGTLPGSLVMAIEPNLIHPFFPTILLLAGCVLGCLICALAATAGVFVDTVRAARRSTRNHGGEARAESMPIHMNHRSDEHPALPQTAAASTSDPVPSS